MGVVKTRRSAPTFETISRFAPTSVGMKVALVAPRLVALAEDADDRMEKVSNFPFAKTNFALKGVSHLSEYTKVEVKHELTGHFCECLTTHLRRHY